jgi:hypothetical protein
MTATRVTISLDRDLARAMKKAAGKQPLSVWLADAAAAKLRNEGLARVVADWEAEHGEITAAELADVDREIARARRRKW